MRARRPHAARAIAYVSRRRAADISFGDEGMVRRHSRSTIALHEPDRQLAGPAAHSLVATLRSLLVPSATASQPEKPKGERSIGDQLRRSRRPSRISRGCDGNRTGPSCFRRLRCDAARPPARPYKARPVLPDFLRLYEMPVRYQIME
jgi:hypothetical protein